MDFDKQQSNVSNDPTDTARRMFMHEASEHGAFFNTIVDDLKDDPKTLFATAYAMGAHAALSYVAQGKIVIINSEGMQN